MTSLHVISGLPPLSNQQPWLRLCIIMIITLPTPMDYLDVLLDERLSWKNQV